MFAHTRKILCIIAFLISLQSQAQYNPQFYLRATESSEREKTHERIINNVILKNLSLPLSEETEENWEGAFNAMEVISYQDAFTWQKMQEAMTNMPFQSITFQRYTLEAAYVVYPGVFVSEAKNLLQVTTDPKIFSMCAVYLMKSSDSNRQFILDNLQYTFGDSAKTQPILSRLLLYIQPEEVHAENIDLVLKTIFSKQFLAGQTLLVSLQRKNRDYPGLALVRKPDGKFSTTDSGYFKVPQLARGIANLPYFLTKGNTPQGIYKMYGFGVSQSQFIGPTANLQMGMPIELSKSKFLNNMKVADSQWTLKDYEELLPVEIRNYTPLFETYYAGLAGRNEIIAHGTTINPEYYKGQPFYPMTPTEGCLCTKEFWDGRIIESDQQKLVNALLNAGGAYGYVVVIEIDDQHRPVTLEDVKKYLPGTL